MNLQTETVYEFGLFRLDSAARSLRHADKGIALTPKMFDVLLYLVERNGQVVEKEELLRAVWPDTFVEEANLTVNISSLRKALGVTGEHYIETVQRRGYRFVALEKQKEESAAPAGIEIIPPPAPQPPPSRARWIIPAILFVTVSLAVGLYHFIRARRAPSPAPFQTMQLKRLTTNGKAHEPVISPDGKYVLYVIADAGKRSLWVRQIAGGSNLQIIPPTETPFGAITISRDGNFVYFLKGGDKAAAPALHQMPLLGGEAKQLLTDIHSRVAVAPNGKQIAFIRRHPVTRASELVIADADGSNAQTLTRRPPEAILERIAWSPDGKTLACHVRINGGLDFALVAIAMADGTEKIISTERWEVGDLAWLADGSGLVISAVRHHPGFVPTNSQLWQVAYPSGEVRRITNDLNHYGGASLTADGTALVTLQRERQSNIWVVPQGQAQLARQITFGNSKEDGHSALAWTPDGRLIYTSDANGKRKLWLMDADGGNAKPLTPDTKDWGNGEVAVAPDGSFIVYVSAFDWPHLWRMNLPNGEARQITFGDGEVNPQISPDGAWLVYAARNQDKPVLMKMPLASGAATQLTSHYSTRPALSPDGKLLAYLHWDEQSAVPPRTVIIPFAGGAPLKSFTFDSPSLVRWSQDGKGLIYADTRAGVSNLRLQPLDDSAARPLTDFKSDRIYNYAWSRDGQQLACVKGVDLSDVVLINGFR